MKSEHRVILAVVLSTAFFILWYTLFSPPQKGENVTAQAEVEKTIETKDVVKEEPKPQMEERRAEIMDTQANLPVEITKIETSLFRAEFTNDGGVPISWQLKGYIKQGGDVRDELVDLVSKDAQSYIPALALSFREASFVVPDLPRYSLVKNTGDEIVYRWGSSEVEITKRIKFNIDKYLCDVSVEVANRTGKALTEIPVLSWSGESIPQKSSGFFDFLKQAPTTNKSPVYYLNGSVGRERSVANIPGGVELSGSLYWAGLEDRYFLSAIVPRDQSSQIALNLGGSDIDGVKGGRVVKSEVSLAKASIPPGDKVVHNFSFYAGPKEINQLKSVGVRLEEAIDYGWFSVISLPILYLLRFFNSIVRNYGLAIILLTIFIKILLQPINKKSLKSMKQMQGLQPRLKELQKKFADDKAKLNAETMQLFKAHKVNPMGGCLPMLLQFPIYIALYKVLWNSIELYQAPFFWFYRDLSAPDPYVITPLLLGVGMFFQQKLMPATSADPAQQKMMMIMPVMFTAFMIFLPVGLVVYILVNTVMSVTQQWMYNNDIRYRDLLRGQFKKTS